MSGQRVRWFWMIGMAVCFALAHTQAPYVWSNQNQYYLHGAAAAGFGDLKNDWLACTKDPTLGFSALVAMAYCFHVPIVLSSAYFLMLMAYFLLVSRLLTILFGHGGTLRWTGLTIFLVMHSAVLRVTSIWLFGKDYPWFFQAGVAGQYVLGPGLQPSVFGAFFLLALVCFSHRTTQLLSATVAAVIAVCHPAYLLPAALFVVGFQLELIAKRQTRRALLLGVCGLGFAMPAIFGTLFYFGPTSPDAFARATEILVDCRLPHHCRVDRWLDGIAISQGLLILIGCGLLRRTVLFRPLVAVLCGGISLSVIQWWTQNRVLALLFPWRVSAILMPVAVAVLVDRLVFKVGRISEDCPTSARPTAILATICLIAAGAGLGISYAGVGYHVNHNEDGIIDFVVRNRHAGEVYLLPVRIPDLRAGPRGSVSLTFARPSQVGQGIPPDFQRFRLATGAAIYVDFKSIPYADTEVIEWYRRLRQCAQWYASDNWENIADELVKEGITHIILPARVNNGAGRLQQMFRDESFQLFRVVAEK